MAFTIRIFGYRGMIQATVLHPHQDSKDSVYLLNQPYEFGNNTPSNGLTPTYLSSTTSFAGTPNPDLSGLLRVEIPDGQAVRYEVTPGGIQPYRVPTAFSPIMFGIQHIQWGPGWVIGFVDAAGT